jgi:hypothetical protein
VLIIQSERSTLGALNIVSNGLDSRSLLSAMQSVYQYCDTQSCQYQFLQLGIPSRSFHSIFPSGVLRSSSIRQVVQPPHAQTPLESTITSSKMYKSNFCPEAGSIQVAQALKASLALGILRLKKAGAYLAVPWQRLYSVRSTQHTLTLSGNPDQL